MFHAAPINFVALTAGWSHYPRRRRRACGGDASAARDREEGARGGGAAWRPHARHLGGWLAMRAKSRGAEGVAGKAVGSTLARASRARQRRTSCGPFEVHFRSCETGLRGPNSGPKRFWNIDDPWRITTCMYMVNSHNVVQGSQCVVHLSVSQVRIIRGRLWVGPDA